MAVTSHDKVAQYSTAVKQLVLQCLRLQKRRLLNTLEPFVNFTFLSKEFVLLIQQSSSFLLLTFPLASQSAAHISHHATSLSGGYKSDTISIFLMHLLFSY